MPPQVSASLAPALKMIGAHLAKLEGRIVKLERGARQAQIGNTSIDSGALLVNDDDGNQVLSVGLQNDGTYAVASTGSSAPDAPSVPTVVPGLLELLVTWDGEMDDGSTPLSDFSAVQVHCSQTEGFTPDAATLQGALPGPGTFRIGGLTAGTGYWVALVTANASGNLSEPSGQAAGQPLAVASAIDAGSLTAQQMGLPGGVLNANPWFAGGYGGDWSARNGTFAVVPASSAPAGSAYGNIGEYVNNGVAAGWMGENAGGFPVTPGASYLITAWVNSSSGPVALGFAWTLAGVYGSATTAALSTTAGTWTPVQAVITAPGSGADGGYPIVGTQTADGSTVYAVAILALASIPGTVIQAGTITADQIAAGTVVAGMVDGTVIEGATIIGTGAGEELILYGGAPADDNMIVSAVSEPSPEANTGGGTVLPGLVAYGQTGGPDSVPLAIQLFQFVGDLGLGPNGGAITPWTTTATPPSAVQNSWTAPADTVFGNGVTLGSIVFALQGSGAYNLYLSGAVGISGGLTVLGKGITSTAGTATAPTKITTDSWHTPGSLPTGWSGTLRYKLMPDNTVMVHCQCTVSTSASTGTITLFSGLSAAYTPANEARGPVGYFVNGTPTAAQLAVICGMRWDATTGGAIQILGFPGGASGSGITEIDFTAVYPLD